MPLNLLYFTVLSLIINTWNSIFINFLKKKKEYWLVFFRKLQLKFKTKDKKINKFISGEKKNRSTKIRSKKNPEIGDSRSVRVSSWSLEKHKKQLLMLGLTQWCAVRIGILELIHIISHQWLVSSYYWRTSLKSKVVGLEV